MTSEEILIGAFVAAVLEQAPDAKVTVGVASEKFGGRSVIKFLVTKNSRALPIYIERTTISDAGALAGKMARDAVRSFSSKFKPRLVTDVPEDD